MNIRFAIIVMLFTFASSSWGAQERSGLVYSIVLLVGEPIISTIIAIDEENDQIEIKGTENNIWLKCNEIATITKTTGFTEDISNSANGILSGAAAGAAIAGPIGVFFGAIIGGGISYFSSDPAPSVKRDFCS